MPRVNAYFFGFGGVSGIYLFIFIFSAFSYKIIAAAIKLHKNQSDCERWFTFIPT